ncbi:DUF126 domain-containing protein [Candidatus Thioglobus sp.]|nr:DUF126 domain-containing protein [Candidatus Thioglobus sp.]
MGGVDPDTGVIIDTHHPNCGEQSWNNRNSKRLVW